MAKSYRTVISLNVVEQEGGQPTPFFATEVVYEALSYEGLVVVESLMTGVLQRLCDLGIAKAGDSEEFQGMLQAAGLRGAPAAAAPGQRR